jgi:hypothetical protein
LNPRADKVDQEKTIMKISYQRTGGFAGMVFSFDVATETLSPDEEKELLDLVISANFFELPATISTDVPGADQFQYKLTVETEEQQHTVEVGDAGVPENLWPLLNKLRILSRSTRNA